MTGAKCLDMNPEEPPPAVEPAEASPAPAVGVAHGAAPLTPTLAAPALAPAATPAVAAPQADRSLTVIKWLVPTAGILFGLIGFVVNTAHR